MDDSTIGTPAPDGASRALDAGVPALETLPGVVERAGGAR